MSTPDNGIYVLQGVQPASIAAAPVAVKVIEIYNDSGELFTSSQVAQMGGGSGNGLLIGYFSIGEAENYRSYFSSLPSSVIGPVDPDWPGDYKVAYWTDAWKSVCADYVNQMSSLGYDGAYFDVVDVCESSWARANAPGGNAKEAMINLVKYLADYAHAKNPNFKIWVNTSGAEDLLTNSTFLNSVDGAFEEELFYQDSGSPQPASETSYNLGLLKNLTAAGKDVIAIEYISGAAKVAAVQAKASAAGIGSYVAHRNLNGVDTEGFATLPPYTGGTTDSGDSGGSSGGTTGATGTINLSWDNPSVTVTGNATVNCNSGTDTITVTAGNVTVNGAKGGTMNFVDTGPGTVTINAMGTDNITLGSGVAVINIIKDASLDLVTINGFKVGTDHLHKVGYGSSTKSGISNAADSSAGVSINFRDGTHVVLNGVHTTDLKRLLN